MINDIELKQLFEKARIEISDNHFVRDLKDRLPHRPSLLPQLVMGVSGIAALLLAFLLQGAEPFFSNLTDMFVSIRHLQAPSIPSIATYLTALCGIGAIWYGMVEME